MSVTMASSNISKPIVSLIRYSKNSHATPTVVLKNIAKANFPKKCLLTLSFPKKTSASIKPAAKNRIPETACSKLSNQGRIM